MWDTDVRGSPAARLFGIAIHVFEVTTRGTFLRTFPHPHPPPRGADQEGVTRAGTPTDPPAQPPAAEDVDGVTSGGSEDAGRAKATGVVGGEGGEVIRLCQRMEHYWPVLCPDSPAFTSLAQMLDACACPQSLDGTVLRVWF